jgi:predicted nucleic acid-binding protein
MRVYLDNCAFNQPFDDQSHIRIRLESEAKLYIQQKIRIGQIELAWSYILDIENDQNPFQEKRNAIARWKRFAVADVEESEAILNRANGFTKIGIKAKDALHVAAAIEVGAQYFITTDDRLIKKTRNLVDIVAINPVDIVVLIDERYN